MSLNFLAFASLVALGQTGGQVKPLELLRKSLDRKPSVNVEAIVSQRTPWGEGRLRLRLMRDRDGRRRTEVIEPVSMQGQLDVDDGVRWTTYFPDNKVVRDHPSPLSSPDDLGFRMRLVRRNYTLEVDDKLTVANRPVFRITAKPKSDDLETRRFYIDTATYLPLKIDILNGMGDVSVQFSVQKIEFPARFDKATFELPNLEGVRRELPRPPNVVQSLDEAERRLGFRPILPDTLPMGFRKTEMVMIERGDWKPIAIRLTDGLVRVIVYQFKRNERLERQPRKQDPGRTYRDLGSIRIEVAGDAPMAARERLLAAFARSAEVPSALTKP